MSELDKVLKINYESDWKAIKDEIQREITSAIENSDGIWGLSEEVEDILLGYGLEPDFITDFM